MVKPYIYSLADGFAALPAIGNVELARLFEARRCCQHVSTRLREGRLMYTRLQTLTFAQANPQKPTERGDVERRIGGEQKVRFHP